MQSKLSEDPIIGNLKKGPSIENGKFHVSRLKPADQTDCRKNRCACRKSYYFDIFLTMAFSPSCELSGLQTIRQFQRGRRPALPRIFFRAGKKHQRPVTNYFRWVKPKTLRAFLFFLKKLIAAEMNLRGKSYEAGHRRRVARISRRSRS